MADSIWYRDLSNFITRDNFLMFFPSQDMTFTEKLNAVMRFTLYFTIIMLLFKGDVRMVFIVVFVGTLTALLHEFVHDSVSDKHNEGTEEFVKSNGTCIRPTEQNPFMNVLMNEYSDSPDRSSACDTDNPDVKKTISSMFNEKLFRGVDDIFYKNSSDRQFYTNPNTKIPNDQDGFARWLYQTDPTCKEGSGTQCFANVFRQEH